jgi:HSP20 family molecular chaperone IbpA
VIVVVSFDDDFEEALRDLDFFSSELVKIIENELDRLLRDMEAEKVGDPPNADDVTLGSNESTGEGRFGLSGPLDPIEPLRPLRPAPKPKKPLGIPRKALKEMTEPLTDVFDKEGTVEVYVELPGIEKENVQVKVREGNVEVRAGTFRKAIELPTKKTVRQAAWFDYRNGVLRIVIPKRLKLRPKDAQGAKTV